MDNMERVHPYYILSGLSAFIVTVFFLYFLFDLTTGIMRSGGQSGFSLPRILFPGSFLLMLSTLPVYRIVQHFENEETRKLGITFGITAVTAVIFTGMQLSGLRELIRQYSGSSHPLILRDITVIILFHLAGVLFFLFYSIFKLANLIIVRNDPVKRLIYFTSVIERIRLNLVKYTWVFAGYLWLFLYVYLLMIL